MLVYNHETGELLADLKERGQRYVAAKGGQGGRGNARFKTSTNRAPAMYSRGCPVRKSGCAWNSNCWPTSA
ncbi:MAG: hypothetical protein R2864_13920 [Syntrophotaleaceae bacterium]